MQTQTNEVLNSTKRAMLFLTPPRETDVERTEAMQRAEKLMQEATVAFLHAGRDDLAQRARELAADAR